MLRQLECRMMWKVVIHRSCKTSNSTLESVVWEPLGQGYDNWQSDTSHEVILERALDKKVLRSLHYENAVSCLPVVTSVAMPVAVAEEANDEEAVPPIW